MSPISSISSSVSSLPRSNSRRSWERASASGRVLSFTRVVIMEAEAWLMEQP